MRLEIICFILAVLCVVIPKESESREIRYDRPDIYGAGVMWAMWWDVSELPEEYQADPRTYDQAQMQKIVEMGGRHCSGTFDWLQIESTRGVYDWTAADQRTADALTKGLKIYAYIGNTPDWAVPPGGLPGYRTPPDDQYQEDFENYCRAVASRYAGQVDHFFFWNEPNGCSWINEGCSNGSEYPLYTHWLKIAYTALKEGNPNCKVAAGRLDCNQFANCWTYVDGMYSIGAQGYFDAIAINPYAHHGVHWDAIHNVRNLMVAHGDADKEVWISEYGWYDSGSGDAPDKLIAFLNQIKQHEYDYVTMCNYLVVTDLHVHGGYGLLDHDLNNRPIYETFRDFDKTPPPTYTPTPDGGLPPTSTPTPKPPGSNLLINPGAETGDLTGWHKAGHPINRSLINPSVHIPNPPNRTGNHRFGMSTTSSDVDLIMYQQVAVEPNRQYITSCWVAKYDGRGEAFEMFWIDGPWGGTHNQIVYLEPAMVIFPQWQQVTGPPIIPTGHIVTIGLRYINTPSYTPIAIHVDDIFFGLDLTVPTMTPTETPMLPTQTATEAPSSTPSEMPINTPTETPANTPSQTPSSVVTATSTPLAHTPTNTPTCSNIPSICIGDADRNGFVNAEDFRSVRDNFGSETCGVGDANGDCFVNVDDFRAVRDNFGVLCD